MAFSQLKGEAQTPVTCQFCEESSDIRWRCINCDVFLCQLCTTKIHRKIKSAEKHEILNLKDCGGIDAAQAIRKVDLQDMPCSTHIGHTCCVYCMDCGKPVCASCLIESHQKHKYKTLNEIYDTTFSKMKEVQNKLESRLEFFDNEKERLHKLHLDGAKNFQKIKNEITLTEKEISEIISKYAKELVQELESIWKPTENKIKAELSDMQKKKDNLLKREENLKKIFLSHQASDIFNSRKLLDETLPKKSMGTLYCDIMKRKFISAYKLEKQNIRTIFGDLYAVPDLELVKSFQSDFPNVMNIVHCDNNMTFITCPTEVKLQKVKFEENNIIIEESIILSALHMAKLNKNDIILSTGGSELQVYSSDKQFKSFKSFSPLKTISVHVSKNNNIFVGLTECYPVTYPATEDCVRRVLIFNQEGDKQLTFEYDNNSQRLLTEPYRIITINDMVYVIDCLNNQWEGRVLGLDYDGKILWTYKGCVVDFIEIFKFYPSDIAAISSGMVLVLDKNNHALHMLNCAGDVIACKDVKPLGIELPLSLSIDSNSILWIGCNTWQADKDSKAKIFAVKLI